MVKIEWERDDCWFMLCDATTRLRMPCYTVVQGHYAMCQECRRVGMWACWCGHLCVCVYLEVVGSGFIRRLALRSGEGSTACVQIVVVGG